MATTPRKDLPGTNAPNWSQRVTEELRVLMGRGGNGRALTAKDLIDSGIAKPGPGGGLVPGVPGSGDTEPDLTPPPTPTGFVAHGAISNLVMEHDPPSYPQGHGHGMTVVYGVIQSPSGPLPTFDKAVELMRFVGAVASYASNPGSTWRLWIKWLSADGVLSVDPAGGINGLEVSTGQDVSQLLDVLNGKITQSQLYATLSREIDLISGTGAGSVNARVLAESQARAQALVAEANSRAQAIAAEAASRAQAIAAEAAARGQDVAAMAAELDAAANDLQARIDAVNAQVSDIIGASDFDPVHAYDAGQLVKYQNKLYRAKVNTVGNLPTNATYWDLVGDYASLGEAVAAHAAQLADHANRITQTEQGLTAEATARTTLAAQLRGNYTGSDVAQVTSGLVWSERQARVSGDSANASAIDAVKTRMPTGTGKVASEASVIDEATARAAADAAAASRTTAIEGRLPAGNGQLATAAAVTALDTRVTSAEGSISSQGGQITSLKNSLATAGGQNLFFNPSFEVVSTATGFADGWEASGNTGTTRTPSLVASWIEPGGKAQRLDCTGLSTTAYVDLRAQVARRPSVVEGQRVALSAYVRGTPGLNVRMFLQAISASGTSLITYNGVYADLTATGTRTELVSPALPAGTVAIVALLRVHGATVASGYVEWDRVQLELGDTVTGWRDNGVASDEATSSAVTALTSRVTAAEGVNTSQSTNITNLQNSVTGLQSSKADASALSALDSKVTGQGNTLTSQGTAITALQNSITNGPVLPSDFSAGLGNWTLARQGDPSVVASAAGTIVSDDVDFGVCAQFNNWTVAGQNVLTKGLVQAIPGRVYRVRARFKVVAAAGFPLGLNLVAGGNTATYANGGDAFSTPISITSSGQIAEITALFSDKVANAAGAIAWGATAVLLRFGLRINGNLASGLQLRVQSIVVEDATADAANADATTALTSRVTAAEGSITSTSSALTTLTNRVTAAEGVNTSQATAISGLGTRLSTAEGTITSQSNSLTSLQAGLDGVGISNLFLDPYFTTGSNPWGLTAAIAPVVLARTSADVPAGAPSARVYRVTGAGAASTYFAIPLVTQARDTYNTQTTARAGDVFDVTMWVYSAPSVGYLRLNMSERNDANGQTAATSVDLVASQASWRKITKSFVIANANTTRVFWQLALMGSVPASDSVFFCEPVLQRRQGSSEVSAAADSALDARVTSAEGAISSTSSALTTLTNRVTAAEGVNATQATAISGLQTSVTTINGTLTSQASQITSLQAGLAEAGGQNLLYNPSFDIESVSSGAGMADGFSRGASTGVAATPSLPTSWLDPLGKAQRYDCTGLAASLYADLITASNVKPAVVEGQHVTLSVYVRATEGLQVQIFMQARASQTTSTTLATYTGTRLAIGEGGTRLTLTSGALPAGTNVVNVIFRVHGTATLSVGFVEWDRAQVELGATVTAWRDNSKAQIDAQAAATTALTNRVSTAEGNISSTSSALTTLTNRVTAAEGVNTSQATAISGLNSSVTSINGTLTSQASQITSLQAGVDQAQKQAVNVIVNPSFDNGSNGWTLRAGWAVVAEGEDGKDCIKLSGASGSTSQPSTLSIAVKAGQTWRFRSRGKRSADFNGTVGSSKIRFTNQGSLLGTLTVAYSEFPVGVWGQVERTLTVTADGELSFTLVRDSTAGSVWLDDFELSNITDIQTLNAAISSEASVRATTDGYLGAQYSVRMQLSQGGQQVVGGFGFSGTTSGTAGPQIDFGVLANSFWIAAPSGSPGGVSNVKPFVVQTTAQTVNGVTVPAGVYMDAAYINNVTALWARFGNLVADTIQATSISVSKLTGGSMSVGSYINSSNYVSGSTGWSINSNGQAEFSGVTVRGAIYSTAGTIGGITINSAGLNSGGFSGYQWPPAGQNGFHIGPNGILLGNANSGRYLQVEANGNIYAPGFSIVNGNANFSGNLSGASGSFSGVLTAQRVISMENLDYNIATVAVGVTAGDLVGPVNGEILGVTAPAADGNATYIVSFHADVGAGSAGGLQIQVDGGTQFQFPMNTGGMKSFSFTFSGNGLTRRVRLYVANNNTSPASTVTARSISVIVSKR